MRVFLFCWFIGFFFFLVYFVLIFACLFDCIVCFGLIFYFLLGGAAGVGG